jgi:hypothetical protein
MRRTKRERDCELKSVVIPHWLLRLRQALEASNSFGLSALDILDLGVDDLADGSSDSDTLGLWGSVTKAIGQVLPIARV